jgi:hypothetical protein
VAALSISLHRKEQHSMPQGQTGNVQAFGLEMTSKSSIPYWALVANSQDNMLPLRTCMDGAGISVQAACWYHTRMMHFVRTTTVVETFWRVLPLLSAQH